MGETVSKALTTIKNDLNHLICTESLYFNLCSDPNFKSCLWIYLFDFLFELYDSEATEVIILKVKHYFLPQICINQCACISVWDHSLLVRRNKDYHLPESPASFHWHLHPSTRLGSLLLKTKSNFLLLFIFTGANSVHVGPPVSVYTFPVASELCSLIPYNLLSVQLLESLKMCSRFLNFRLRALPFLLIACGVRPESFLPERFLVTLSQLLFHPYALGHCIHCPLCVPFCFWLDVSPPL